MSKAEEWAQKVTRADIALDQVKGERPGTFALLLNTKDRIYLIVDDNGRPRMVTPEARIGYELEAKPLIEMAHWILDTFGEEENR